jgi:transcriptional regulator with XRE-family HTH domain
MPPTPLRERVGGQLRRLRGERSRSEMARQLGISRSWLIRLEDGKANATLDLLDDIGGRYGVTFDVTTRKATTR